MVHSISNQILEPKSVSKSDLTLCPPANIITTMMIWYDVELLSFEIGEIASEVGESALNGLNAFH